jgi:hypothetical protein
LTSLGCVFWVDFCVWGVFWGLFVGGCVGVVVGFWLFGWVPRRMGVCLLGKRKRDPIVYLSESMTAASAELMWKREVFTVKG